MSNPAASILRILGITTAVLLLLAAAAYWLYAQATPLTQRILEGQPPTIENFINIVRSPPVCYYEGISERTEPPHSTRDWAYTLLLGDCHPQQYTITRALIDALTPRNSTPAGSLSHHPPGNRVQYAQEVTAATPHHSIQEID